ncbi:MAG: SUMF1/EgtB/PvdO family nonheme iron enzyme [Candidatus Eisenbacteria bacterium]|nr:SUMF1/EgtB/PvdO family nonheme iron enzyme [Candidatus Eisenbacteria bacterium]
MEAGSNRVIRGGNWNNNAQNCRSANRNNNNPGNSNNNIGFRLASSCTGLTVRIQGCGLRAIGHDQATGPVPPNGGRRRWSPGRLVGKHAEGRPGRRREMDRRPAPRTGACLWSLGLT